MASLGEKKEAAKRAQAVQLRALLRYALTSAARLSPGGADAAIAELFNDPSFIALNKAFHERAFTVYLND
jgi:hypothetical protein